jgi:hypothetical protein
LSLGPRQRCASVLCCEVLCVRVRMARDGQGPQKSGQCRQRLTEGRPWPTLRLGRARHRAQHDSAHGRTADHSSLKAACCWPWLTDGWPSCPGCELIHKHLGHRVALELPRELDLHNHQLAPLVSFARVRGQGRRLLRMSGGSTEWPDGGCREQPLANQSLRTIAAARLKLFD